MRCPKFKNYDVSTSTKQKRGIKSQSQRNFLELGIVSQTKAGIIIASQAHNLCKSSKGLTLPTVSLVYIQVSAGDTLHDFNSSSSVTHQANQKIGQVDSENKNMGLSYMIQEKVMKNIQLLRVRVAKQTLSTASLV